MSWPKARANAKKKMNYRSPFAHLFKPKPPVLPPRVIPAKATNPITNEIPVINIIPGTEFQAMPPMLLHNVTRKTNRLVVNSNNVLLNGEYVAKSSSQSNLGGGLNAILAFDNDQQTFWQSAHASKGYQQDPYKSGKYIGGGKPNQKFITKTVSGEQFAGEWIEINLPYKLHITRYTLLTAINRNTMSVFPTKFTLLGSNDGIAWTIVDRPKLPADPRNKYNLFKPVEFNVSKTEMFNTFRIVFEELINDAKSRFAAVSSIQLYGLYPKFNLDKQIDNIQPYSNNGMQVKEGYTAMENETRLLDHLNDFNSKYAAYISCKENGIPTGCILQNKENELNTAYTTIVQTNNNVLSGGSLYDLSGSIAVSSGVSESVADASFNDIKAKHREIMRLRSELDAKLKEVYVTDDSFAYEQQRIFDGTLYTSLLWTVLATSLLYYTFKKL